MKTTERASRRRMRVTMFRLALLAMGVVPAHAQDGATLRARHDSLGAQLAHNPFHRPLHLESVQSADELKGDIYAVVTHPFAVVENALQRVDGWCDLLLLHLNVKECSAQGNAPKQVLSMYVGRKVDQPLKDAFRVDFNFSLIASGPDYLSVQMTADKGPLSTRRYRIGLEAVPLDPESTFLHLSYSYGYGMAARLAMQGYLSTVGRDKVGFSVVGRSADGKPIHVDGVRGVVERNTMRYYLAIDAYLGALAVPRADQVEKRLHDWYAAVDHYPVQLHDLERSEYLAMKRREVQRQQALAKAARSGGGRP